MTRLSHKTDGPSAYTNLDAETGDYLSYVAVYALSNFVNVSTVLSFATFVDHTEPPFGMNVTECILHDSNVQNLLY